MENYKQSKYNTRIIKYIRTEEIENQDDEEDVNNQESLYILNEQRMNLKYNSPKIYNIQQDFQAALAMQVYNGREIFYPHLIIW